MRNLIQEAASKDEALAIIKSVITKAKDGDMDAVRWIGPYIFGAPPKQPDVIIEDNRQIVAFQLPDWWAPPQLPTTPYVIDADATGTDTAETLKT